MGIWLSSQDLVNATSYAMLEACFSNGDSGGAPDQDQICGVIDRAETQVLSWLIPEYGPAPLSAALMAQFACDKALKYAALDYAVAYMLDKHPEYVRAKRQED